MAEWLRRVLILIAFCAVLPWSQTCSAAGLDGWGARYAVAESNRVKMLELKSAEVSAQGLVGTAESDAIPERVSDRQVAVELIKITASLLVPGLGIVFWLAD